MSPLVLERWFGLLPAVMVTLAVLVAHRAWVLGRVHPGPTVGALVLRDRRPTRAAVALLSGLAVWLGAYGLQVLVPDERTSIWLQRAAFAGIVLVPPAWLFVGLFFTDPPEWVRRWALRIVLPVCAVSLATNLGNDFVGWFWESRGVAAVGSLHPVQTTRGPWFYVHTVFSYVCLLGGLTLLAGRYRRSPSSDPMEVAGMVLAFAAPVGLNAVQLVLREDARLDLTPLGLLLSSVVFLRVLQRTHLAPLLPEARARVLDELGDAVLVLDERGRVLDANQPGASLLERFAAADSTPEHPLEERFPELACALERLEDQAAELALETGTEAAHFDLRVSPLQTDDGTRLRIVALRDVSDRRRAEQALFELAHFDPLTGLANRRHFAEHLERVLNAAAIQESRAALLLIDLDHFKLVNDTRGHAAGDALLRAVGRRLRSCLRDRDAAIRLGEAEPSDGLGRLGGDEFAVVLPHVRDGQDVSRVARRLLEALGAPGDDELPAPVGASIGIAIFPEDGESSEAILKAADLALYHAKREGRGRFHLFHPQLDRLAQREATIVNEFVEATKTNQLHLVYQPKFELATKRLTGLEALVRWTHPELGPLSPAEFVPIVEQNGLALVLGRWVLERAALDMAEWRALGLELPKVAVNVSAKELAAGDFVDHLAGSLRRHGILPDRIEIEITERTLLADDDETTVALRDLRAIGVTISLDDFGTGYSSLVALSRTDIDVLKLDRSLLVDFYLDPRSVEIVSSLVGLAHRLGMTTVAEGVSEDAQLPLLHRIGCDQVQGFLFSPPVSRKDAEAFLRRSSR